MMLYNGSPSPTNNWPSNEQYSSYHPTRRFKNIIILILGVVTLVLSVAALIVVFSVEHSWFSDSYNQTNNHFNYYGLWRLCFFTNQTCDSWFSTGGPFSFYVYDRLNQAKVGINAWQALEIVFLFLITSTLVIALLSCIYYRFQWNIHYYLAILAIFCAWPAVCTGLAGLFVFGFSVYNVSLSPHNLEWCFYVNLVAVILALIASILLTIYGIVLKRPRQSAEENTIVETLTDINSYPTAYDPSTFIIVRRNKKKRKKPYDYPQILYPQQQQNLPARTISSVRTTDYITNPNHQMLRSYNPPLPQQQQGMNPYTGTGVFPSRSVASMPPQSQYYPSPMASYRYQPAPWHQADSNPIPYNPEPVNDYIQRGIYRPSRLKPIETRDEARVLHYYTGLDHFATVEPSDVILTRHHPGVYPGRPSPSRYPSYYPPNDYMKSTM